MSFPSVRLEGRRITGWDSFHDESQRVFGFPAFYGRNLNAWIDCMMSIDRAEDGMSSIHVAPGATLAIEILDARHLKHEYREQYDALIECTAFVNWSRLQRGEPPSLALSFRVE